ncbi:MAG TPA: proline racemase family protein, partial [Vicinamibacterales bacterium]|nr:proline racemase family protein [Vicinamibacterales bacterium]
PRGHADMSAVLLTEPSSADAHAGLVFLDAAGCPRFAMPGVMAAATAAVAHGLISTGDDGGANGIRLVFDTPAGAITAFVDVTGGGTGHVRVRGVPAFVHAAGVPVALPGRTVPVDLAFSGEFYALVDGEAAGVPLDDAHVPELRRLGKAACAAVNQAVSVAHPDDRTLEGVTGVLFTGPARDDGAHLRSVLVTADGAVDSSPGGSATAAVMAVLDAMGLLGHAPAFIHEGLSGAQFTGRVESRAQVGELPALVVDVEARAWPTGEETWILDHDDPFCQGLRTAVAG